MFPKQVCSLLFFILLFGFTGLLSGCAEDNRMAARAIQGRIDSAVRARLEAERLRLQIRNDSLIVQEARRRADSAHATGAPDF